MDDKQQLKRRDFMSIATWAIGILIGAGLGLPAVAYIIGPALREEEAYA
ncbi:MAG TPA: hypothetical protein VMX56_07015 [Anaerolineales bacterium]|nr:hypothetical protein [Anaerolineales bacterium]